MRVSFPLNFQLDFSSLTQNLSQGYGGSIPLLWDQIVDLTYKPKFEIVHLRNLWRLKLVTVVKVEVWPIKKTGVKVVNSVVVTKLAKSLTAYHRALSLAISLKRIKRRAIFRSKQSNRY